MNTKLILVAGQSGDVRQVTKVLLSGVRATPRQRTPQLVVRVDDRHAVGINHTPRPVQNIVSDRRAPAVIVARNHQQPLVVKVIGHAVAGRIQDVGDPSERVVIVSEAAVIRIEDECRSPLIIVVALRRLLKGCPHRIGHRIRRAAQTVGITGDGAEGVGFGNLLSNRIVAKRRCVTQAIHNFHQV